MTNSRASSKFILLDHHLAAGTEAQYTFTKTLDMKLHYRELQIIITGKATAALTMRLKVNGQVDYDYSNIAGDTTTITTGLGAAVTSIPMLAAGILDGANSFYIKATIVLNDADDTLMVFTHGTAPHEGQEINGAHPQTGTTTTVTSVDITTSTSTWIAGTEISIYGLKR